MLDPEGLPETFEVWQAAALARAERDASAAGRRLVRVLIHPAELETWARDRGRQVDERTRADFAEVLWRADVDRWRAGAATAYRRGSPSVRT